MRFGFQIAAFGADEFAGPRGEQGEDDFAVFVGLLDARGFEIFENDFGEVGCAGALRGDLGIDDVVVFVNG